MTQALTKPSDWPAINDARAQVKSLAVDADITTEKLQNLVATVGKIASNKGDKSDMGGRFWTMDFTQEIQKLIELRDAQKMLKGAPVQNPLDQEKFRQTLDKLPTADPFSGADDHIKSMAECSRQVAENLERAAKASDQLAVTQPGSTAQNHAAGGSIYFAGGGEPRGQDVIPSMLSPGEFVVNARAAQLRGTTCGNECRRRAEFSFADCHQQHGRRYLCPSGSRR